MKRKLHTFVQQVIDPEIAWVIQMLLWIGWFCTVSLVGIVWATIPSFESTTVTAQWIVVMSTLMMMGCLVLLTCLVRFPITCSIPIPHDDQFSRVEPNHGQC